MPLPTASKNHEGGSKEIYDTKISVDNLVSGLPIELSFSMVRFHALLYRWGRKVGRNPCHESGAILSYQLNSGAIVAELVDADKRGRGYRQILNKGSTFAGSNPAGCVRLSLCGL